jgi:signal transduction histidine kinase
MPRSSRYGKPVYVLLLAALLLLFIIQYFWLRYTWQLKEKDFEEKVRLSLRVYGNLIQEDSTLVKSMRAIWYDSTRLPQTVEVLQHSIDTFFTNSNIPHNYVFGIGKRRSPVFWISDASYRNVLDSSQHSIIGLCMEKKGFLYVSFAFPGKTKYIFLKLFPLLVLSAFSLLMLIFCFIHLVKTIRWQRKLAEMKNDFINNMTHEIKTPLFTISVASRMVSEQIEAGSNEKSQVYLQSIRQETTRLNNLLEAVLETARLERQELVFEKKMINFHEMVRQVSESFKSVECQKEGKITLNLHAAAYHIHADQVQISNMLHNLVDNAFKFTNKSPQIIMSTASRDNNLIFSIKDNGIGFDRETKELIFERFYRAHTGNLYHVKGYGIGLNYVKSVVKAHGGSITVKSVVNKGSEFIIHLPFIYNGRQHEGFTG